MCGIIGYLGNCACFKPILGGLKQLQNRGYDSSGICTIEKNNDDHYSFKTTKFASSDTKTAIEKVESKMNDHESNIGIGHTR